MNLKQKILAIQGPILILGSSGFVGANLLQLLIAVRKDVFGTYFTMPAWRLKEVPAEHTIKFDLTDSRAIVEIIKSIKPKTIIDFVAYGAYSFETNRERIYQTNFMAVTRLLEELESKDIACYLHAGTSSEYGDNASGATEGTLPEPNSHYAVSKVAVANLLHYYGKKQQFPCANLRMFSVYGPLEDPARLIPTVISNGLQGKYPAGR